MKRKYEIKNNKKPTTKQNIKVNVCMSYMLGPLHTVLLIRSLSWKKNPKTLIRDPPMYSLTFRLMRHVIV